LLPLFAAGVIDTGGNLPPASLTPVAKMVEKFATGVADTGGKFPTGVVDKIAAGDVDTSGKFATGVVKTGDAP
jgi:hypothetical protein